jgi:putative flavoprotein involved in K+ transport
MRVERFEAVVGAGQAGLAAGCHLARHDMDFVILRASRLGDTWRERWDSLRLFTPAGYSRLPGMHFPAPASHLPDKDEVAEYLTRYADRFDLPVRLESRVNSLARRRSVRASYQHQRRGGGQRRGGHRPVPTEEGPGDRSAIVARRSSTSFERVPQSAGDPGWSVLVVGAGNSGAQIALELARYRKVWLAGRSPGHPPRRLLAATCSTGFGQSCRAPPPTRLGRRLRERTRHGSDQRIGIDEAALANAGIVRVGRLTNEQSGLPECEGT